MSTDRATTNSLSVPPVDPHETRDEYHHRVFGLLRSENGDDDHYDHKVRITFTDGRSYEAHPGGTSELVYSIQTGADEEFTAFCTDRPWFVFRTREVADVAVAR